jgi:hypothetical protein
MSTLTDEINNQIDGGRQNIERSLDNLRKMGVSRVPPAGLVAAGLLVTAIAAGVAWVVYHSRHRRTLVQRVQDSLPDTVRDLPAELRSQVKRVRAL